MTIRPFPPRRRPWRSRALRRDPVLLALLIAAGFLAAKFGLPLMSIAFILCGCLVLLAFLGLALRAFASSGDRRPLHIARQINWGYLGLALAIGVGACVADRRQPSSRGDLSAPLQAGEFFCQVASIHDGDTLRCADGTRVRLHAVAAREVDGTCSPGHPCPSASADAAREQLVLLAGGQTLRCRQTGTTYNRIAAICRNATGVEINCAMVRSGTALVWPRYDQQAPICRS